MFSLEIDGTPKIATFSSRSSGNRGRPHECYAEPLRVSPVDAGRQIGYISAVVLAGSVFDDNGIGLLGPHELGLLKNARERSWMPIVSRLAGNCHSAGLRAALS